MKKLLFTTIAFIAVSTANAQTWSIDKGHSKVGFGATHLLISSVEGQFKSFDATITSAKEDFSDATVEFTADVNSLNTDNTDRDNHLKNPDFFDVTKYNSLTFKSTSLKKIEKNVYQLEGNLTMHGITKSIAFTANFGGIAVHPYTKKTMAGFKISGKLKRTDFGIGASIPTAMVSDEIVIFANTEFAKN
jgi:polyisoprenoid-binding protein YceI